MSLSTLHDVPLLRIFYYLPMSDLLVRINLVCHRWNDLFPTACSQRRSLVLLIGHFRESLAHFNPFGIPFLSELKDGGFKSISQLEDTKFSEWSRVELSGLSTEKIVRLTSLLSKITSLTWIEYNPTNHLSFQLLWSTLTDKLITLKIIFPNTSMLGNYYKHAPTYFWNGFFGRIFVLSKLKNLNFYYDREIGRQINLAPIGKLEKFNFYLPDDNIESGVWESLRRHASRRTRQLGLLNCFPRNLPNLDYTDDTQLATTFTHLSFNQILRFDIGHFQNVTTVKLSNFERLRPLSVYFLPLSHLPQLIHVILYFEPNNMDTLTFLASTPKSEVELTSVKVLSLHFESFYPHSCSSVGNDIFKVLIKFFPKIQYFSFFTFEYGCSSCGFCPRPVRMVLPCLRSWLRELKSVQIENHEQKQLSLLTHIEINVMSCNLYRKWSVEEL